MLRLCLCHSKSQHYPEEVREAYDTLLPGAFKADIFRYCLLFIHGGVYADVDILLESNLDAVLKPDVGFMVPIDKPGRGSGRGHCVWNGLLAAAPGHPYLAKAIENVVNQVRNKFTVSIVPFPGVETRKGSAPTVCEVCISPTRPSLTGC